MRLERRHDPAAFPNGEDLIYFHLRESLHLLRGRPFHFNQVHSLCRANAKLKSQITLRHHTRSAMDLIDLSMLTRHNAHPRSNGGPVAFGPNELDLDPVLPSAF